MCAAQHIMKCLIHILHVVNAHLALLCREMLGDRVARDNLQQLQELDAMIKIQESLMSVF